ncbi:pseudouridine synthase [Rubrivivax gelatinosus]|uniref:Pseudouridine synthase n=1 Tax=Rubrivivax gelatinosus (strain NBRC 100245 / IL144) TaxID=983917 RepID=I0HSW3_RUBGI|nr:pseudouridine synthase [Rubrivivax gelatinosus]BAL96100.1 ribosomal large subunit pseudouridine synthase B RluB [Rubrivivax gelatinosus IL144]
MSSNDAESTPDPIAAVPPADEAPPKKRRAPRKKAEAPAADVAPAAEAVAAPEAPAPEAAAEPAAEAKPRRRRTTKKAAAAEAPAAEPVAVVESLPAAAAERAPEPAPTVVPAEAPPRAEPAPAPEHAAEPSAEPAGEGADAAPAEAGAEGDAPRRSRNRRRGRRGERAERAPRDAAAPAAEGEDVAGDDEAPETAPAPQLPPADVGEVFASVLSGVWDAEAGDEAPPLPAKRVLAPEPDAPKLHKVLAQAGIGSRRDMEQMILEGRITVNGEPAHIGQRIAAGDRIAVGGKPVRYRIAPPPTRVIAYHKPAGEVVTHDDPQQRPTVFRRLPKLHQGKWQSVGRLDINTEGLLLFTNSGELANQLMHPRFGVEREYAVRSLGGLDDAARQKLLEGVEIDGQRCGFKSIENGGGEGANQWYRCVITEGRNREVRKLFDAVGHAVSRLIRIRYGSVVLPKGLKRGVWVDLSEQDVRSLRRMTGVGERPEGEQRDAGGDRRGKRGKRGRGGNAPESAPRGPKPQRREAGEAAIPNPLQQTFDKRAIQQERQRRREIPEDGPIPNPLQQTYDKRGLQRDRPVRDLGEDGPIPNPLQQTYDKRFVQKPKPLAGGRGARGPKKGGAGGQPDPMQTSVGYIGGDAFLRKANGGGGRGGPRGGRGGGGGGGGGRRGGR